MLRKPAVAGRFYSSNPEELTQTIRDFIEPGFNESISERRRAIGVVAPHAGYMYSGHVAGAVYSRIAIPPKVIILCPNHTGLGPALSIMPEGAWETPLGQFKIDETLASALMQADPDLRSDHMAHQFEHATEVQLPFLQSLARAAVQFVPITVGTGNYDSLERLGKAIAEVLRNRDHTTLIIASSDMNHYESDSITRIKDRKAIDQVLALNPEGLFDTVKREKISMCGYGPTVSMLVAARLLGASRSELIKYATSADVSEDYDRVVGYAGIVVY